MIGFERFSRHLLLRDRVLGAAEWYVVPLLATPTLLF